MGYETNGKGTNTTRKDDGDYGSVINAIIVFDEDDPQPRIIHVDPAFMDTSGAVRIGNPNNWSQKSHKNVKEVYVADEATTTEVAEAATNTDAVATEAVVITDINNGNKNIETAKMSKMAIQTADEAINTDTINKPAETLTEAINVVDKGIVTDVPTADKAISTDKYTSNKAIKADLRNKDIATKTKRVKIPLDINKVVSKTKETKPNLKVKTTIKPPSAEAASLAYIPVPIAAAGTRTTEPRTSDKSINLNLIPHKVASNPKLVYPKYTDIREAAVKAVSDIAATAEEVATTKIATKGAATNEIGTEPDKNVQTTTKNFAMMTLANGTATPSKSRVKREHNPVSKARRYYPSPLSSSEDDNVNSWYIIYASTVL